MQLTEEEMLLNSFANKLYDSDRSKYNSKFVKIYNELVKHFKVSRAWKAGSFGKNTKIKLYGDMDLTFTIDNPAITKVEDFRKELEKKLKQSFPNDHVELKTSSVVIDFKGDMSIDVVYLPKEQFEKERKQIRHIKSISQEIRNIIILAKYWKYEKKKDKMKSYEIEWNAIYSSANTYKKRLLSTLNDSGAGSEVNNAYKFLLKEAKGGKSDSNKSIKNNKSSPKKKRKKKYTIGMEGDDPYMYLRDD